MDKENIKGLECRFGTYITDVRRRNDCVVIKEYTHTIDGRVVPGVRCLVNYAHDFWITKENYRTHKQKREWENLSRLTKYTSTRVQLPARIQQALNNHGPNKSLKHVCRSPYVYGVDIKPESVIKQKYQAKYPDCISKKYSVSAFDIETDVLHGTDEMIMASLTFGSRIVTAVNRSFYDGRFAGTDDEIKARIRAAFQHYLGDLIEERELVLELELFDNPGDGAAWVISKMHEYLPDFVSIWNINFDLPKVIDVLEKYGHDLADVFSHPSVPAAFKYFEYIEGPETKKKDNGPDMKLHWVDRWHEVVASAGSYWIDAAAVYRMLRFAGGMLPSYKLESILNKHIKRGKLKFEQCAHLDGLEWHEEMQANFKDEYVIYNIFDCIGLELLDETIKDLNTMFPIMADLSPFKEVRSGPRSIANDLHYFCLLEEGKVAASTSNDMEEELDSYLPNRLDWIVTLPSYMVIPHDNEEDDYVTHD